MCVCVCVCVFLFPIDAKANESILKKLGTWNLLPSKSALRLFVKEEISLNAKRCPEHFSLKLIRKV